MYPREIKFIIIIYQYNFFLLGDSEGSSSFGNTSDQGNLDNVPLAVPQTTTARYGLTGLRSPDLQETIRRKSVTSPPGRSRTSTALSMYSDDFEESQIWESQDQSDDQNSDTSSISHSSDYCSVDSQIKDMKVLQAGATSDHSRPIKSNGSPEKSKNLKEKKKNGDQDDDDDGDDDASDKRSFQGDSNSHGERHALDTPEISREQCFDSLDSTNSIMMSSQDQLDISTSDKQGDVESKNVLMLPRPLVDLGYTY
jgi:hypothetical protein